MDYLSKFNKFITNLSESLDTSNIEIKWIDKSNRLIGLFEIGTNTYQLDFNLVGDSWSYKFYSVAKDENGRLILNIKKTGINVDRFKVISVAKKGLIYLIENKNPNAVVYSASNEVDDKTIKVNDIEVTKRQNIYQNLSQQITEYYPIYKYLIHQIDGNQIYVVIKENLINPELTYSNIQKVIEDYIR